MNYNQDAWRMVEEKVKAEIAAAVTTAVASGGAVKSAIDAAVAAHETKAAGATFTNSHVVAG